MSEPGGLLSVGDKTGLEAISTFVLLDLIGAAQPSFHDSHESGTKLFQRMVSIGKYKGGEALARDSPSVNIW